MIIGNGRQKSAKTSQFGKQMRDGASPNDTNDEVNRGKDEIYPKEMGMIWEDQGKNGKPETVGQGVCDSLKG